MRELAQEIWKLPHERKAHPVEGWQGHDVNNRQYKRQRREDK